MLMQLKAANVREHYNSVLTMRQRGLGSAMAGPMDKVIATCERHTVGG